MSELVRVLQQGLEARVADGLDRVVVVRDMAKECGIMVTTDMVENVLRGVDKVPPQDWLYAFARVLRVHPVNVVNAVITDGYRDVLDE